jgi:hypothetical protein
MRHEVGEFVGNLDPGDQRPRSFGAIEVEARESGVCGADEQQARALQATLWVTDADNPGVTVAAAHTRMLQITLGRGVYVQALVTDMHLIYAAGHAPWVSPRWWAELFTDDRIAESLAGRLRDHGVYGEDLASVLIVQDVFVDEAFRAHHLGALLAAEMADMATGGGEDDRTHLLLGVPRFGSGLVCPDPTKDPTWSRARDYWSRMLGLQSFGDPLYGVLSTAAGFRKAVDALQESLVERYLQVDVTALRSRYDREDPTLFPEENALLPTVCPSPFECPDFRDADEPAEEVLRQIAGVTQAIADVDPNGFPAAEVEVTATISFYAAEQAKAFQDAARYLSDADDAEVRGTAFFYDELAEMYCLRLTVGPHGA